jgi:uncharacterized delta-60 repeat protein
MVEWFNADGTVNTSIGIGGRSFASFGRNTEMAMGIARDAEGKIVAVGSSANGAVDLPPNVIGAPNTIRASAADFAVARFNSDGTLDATFNGNGKTTANFETGRFANIDVAADVAIQSDGKIVLGGTTQNPVTRLRDFAAARFLSTGAIDPTFGSVGLARTDFLGSDGCFGMTMTADDRVVEVGQSVTSPKSSSLAMLRYTNDASAINGPIAKVEVTSVVPVRLAKSIVGGTSGATGLVNVVVAEKGELRAWGPITLSVYASADQTLDGSDVLIGGRTRNIKLKTEKSITFTLGVKLPAVAVDEDRFILASVSGTGVARNSKARSISDALHVLRQQDDLVGTMTPQPPLALRYGQAVSIGVPLTNAGTVAAVGLVTYDLLVSADPNGNSILSTSTVFNRAIAAAPGRTVKQMLTFKTPPAGQLAPGSYFLLVRLTSNTFKVPNLSDGQIVAVVPFAIA